MEKQPERNLTLWFFMKAIFLETFGKKRALKDRSFAGFLLLMIMFLVIFPIILMIMSLVDVMMSTEREVGTLKVKVRVEGVTLVEGVDGFHAQDVRLSCRDFTVPDLYLPCQRPYESWNTRKVRYWFGVPFSNFTFRYGQEYTFSCTQILTIFKIPHKGSTHIKPPCRLE